MNVVSAPLRLLGPALRYSALTAVCLPSCFGKTNGDLAAVNSGDLSHPFAERRPPEEPLHRACGAASVTERGHAVLRRRPFLQQVTDGSALLVLRMADPSAAPPIEVTRPDGSHVLSATPARDPSVPNQHVATLRGLEPATLYCYEIPGLVTKTGFVTAPAAGSRQPVRFAAIGDSGTGDSDQLAVAEQLGTVPFDFVVHLGDLAYEKGRPSEIERSFFGVYASLIANFPVFPIAGNHEYATDDGAPFRQAFVLPENGGSTGRERWYSFDWGDVHFVGLDTEVFGDEQTAWLEQDLSDNDRPWTVVLAHRPPFSSGKHGSSLRFRRDFVPILERHRVALVLAGHEHNYERTSPINGVTYVVTGGGGRETRSVGVSAFTAFSEAVLHFVYVEIEGNQLALHAIDGVGREFDQAVITRPAVLHQTEAADERR
ncbi:MAG TPA: metallophosphoesterase [Polyangiaceae bacterium]|nr:metallophosphoesterase [Polyangiaceae bacterium]